MSDSSFMKNLFHGGISEELLFPYPQLKGEELENVQLMTETVRRFLDEKVDASAIDRNHEIPKEVLDEAKALGLFGLQIPTEYGGLGLGASAYSRVMQEVAAHDSSLTVTLGAHQSIG